MFTGIIEEKGTVAAAVRGTASARLSFAAREVCVGTKVGDSIAVNGVCLTVTDVHPTGFTADAMAETLSRSSLGSLKQGERVNLERALTLSSRLGGHMVSGHIDGTGKIRAVRKEDIADIYTIGCAEELLRYIIEKGSVALDGISLTVTSVTDGAFSVSVIPHTKQQTTLSDRKPGDAVNVECDMAAKYIEKLTGPRRSLSEEFLRMNGF